MVFGIVILIEELKFVKDNIFLLQDNSNIKEIGLIIKNKEMHKYIIKMDKNISDKSKIIKDKEIIVFINGKMELKLSVLSKIIYL